MVSGFEVLATSLNFERKDPVPAVLEQVGASPITMGGRGKQLLQVLQGRTSFGARWHHGALECMATL